MCSGVDENCIFQRGGQVDCWPMDCPPVQCEHPVVSPGDCCPRCEDDPCTLYEGNGSAPDCRVPTPDTTSSAAASGGSPATIAPRVGVK